MKINPFAKTQYGPPKPKVRPELPVAPITNETIDWNSTFKKLGRSINKAALGYDPYAVFEAAQAVPEANHDDLAPRGIADPVHLAGRAPEPAEPMRPNPNLVIANKP